ncbi:hypothetical protein WISP_90578 [Willisornis vidua]|uniref:Uncharacterized protein n=1 Tax=Willisornis vidua TaxID=1566151 RepID=A0ABQ9D645_9PASS|nr:hypothetical protein WISP_90578 [Willisornis vidua]
MGLMGTIACRAVGPEQPAQKPGVPSTIKPGAERLTLLEENPILYIKIMGNFPVSKRSKIMFDYTLIPGCETLQDGPVGKRESSDFQSSLLTSVGTSRDGGVSLQKWISSSSSSSAFCKNGLTSPPLTQDLELVPLEMLWWHWDHPAHRDMEWFWVGRPSSSTPAMGRDNFYCPRFLQAPSNLALDPSRDGAATASLGTDMPSQDRVVSCAPLQY